MAESTGYGPDGMKAVGEAAARQETAMQLFLEALDHVRREIEIAMLTIESEDLEATAYHLRRAFSFWKFAGGELGAMRERQKVEDKNRAGQGASGAR